MFNSKIPLNSKNFQRIIQFFLFECPVETYKRIDKEKETDAERENQIHPHYNYHFHRVSHRGFSFADKELTGAKLNSFRAAMKRVAETDITLLAVDEINEIDLKSEFVIIKKNPGNVSDTEGLFYCIRNALAHGSFEVLNNKYYYFENRSGDKLKGIARLKEKTLLSWIGLFNMPIDEIKKAGK